MENSGGCDEPQVDRHRSVRCSRCWGSCRRDHVAHARGRTGVRSIGVRGPRRGERNARREPGSRPPHRRGAPWRVRGSAAPEGGDRQNRSHRRHVAALRPRPDDRRPRRLHPRRKRGVRRPRRAHQPLRLRRYDRAALRERRPGRRVAARQGHHDLALGRRQPADAGRRWDRDRPRRRARRPHGERRVRRRHHVLGGRRLPLDRPRQVVEEGKGRPGRCQRLPDRSRPDQRQHRLRGNGRGALPLDRRRPELHQRPPTGLPGRVGPELQRRGPERRGLLPREHGHRRRRPHPGRRRSRQEGRRSPRCCRLARGKQDEHEQVVPVLRRSAGQRPLYEPDRRRRVVHEDRPGELHR